MANCLNCNKEVKQVEGKRARLYCDGKCKGEYWRGGRTKDKRKTILVSEYKELVRLARIGKMVKGEKETAIDYKIRMAENKAEGLEDLLS